MQGSNEAQASTHDNGAAKSMQPIPPTDKTSTISPLASPMHTILVLAVLGVWAARGILRADSMRSVAEPDRVSMYLSTLLFEWIVVLIVFVGVWKSGSPLHSILGERWRSFTEFLRDIGIAMVFWIASTLLLSMISPMLKFGTPERGVQYLLPQGIFETALWIALSVTAGICEEAIYRGYLQRQFASMMKSLPLGILLSAAAFGAAHSYKGPKGALLACLTGLTLGVLAAWRRSVRPGMIAHIWGDMFAGVFARMLKIPIA